MHRWLSILVVDLLTYDAPTCGSGRFRMSGYLGHMVLYNTLMGVCAGTILLLVADFLRKVSTGRLANPIPLYGPALLALGIPLTLLSLHMALTWPLTVNPPINIAFAEPSLMLGVLATIGGGFLTKLNLMTNDHTLKINDQWLAPVKWIVFVLGLVLALIASAIFSYDLVGDAPPQEPITGQATGWENVTFGLAYSIAAAGCLVAPWVKVTENTVITHSMVWWWRMAGIFFLLFSVLNYRTHIGLLINLEQGTNYRW